MIESLDLVDFIPNVVYCGKNSVPKNLSKNYDNEYINLSYITEGYNSSTKEYSLTISRKIEKTIRTFEILGLLQAEMGKTQNGTLSFANNQPKIINYVLNWFKKELELNKSIWRWSIKLNINEPSDNNYKKEIESKVINYWTNKTKISLTNAYPKKVTYIKNTHNIKLKPLDTGSLVLEYRNNLFSQVIKNLVKEITYKKVLDYNSNLIQGYIRGILAGESTVELSKKDKKYRIHITALKNEEREIYKNCLNKIGIEVKSYNNYKDLIISKKENNIKLLNQRLMTLHPKKYAKFLNMMQQYPNIENETDYFKPKGKNIWNKHPEDKINRILETYKNSPNLSCRKIANIAGVSPIKVNRVLRENNLGKRMIQKTPESKRKEIADYTKEHPELNMNKISRIFNVHISIVTRSYKKYYGIRGMAANKKISKKIEQKIIDLYKENPSIKYSKIIEITGVSSTVIKRIRRENNLENLGFKHLIGNNNPNKDKILKKTSSN